MGKKRNIKQMTVYHDYYSRLKNLALSVFVWEGLPDTCNARFLEQCLYNFGRAVFVEDKEMRFLNLQCTPSGVLNVYNESSSYTAYSTGYTKQYNADDCVFIRNNYLEQSTDFFIMQFAERLARIQLAIDVNINAQKTPILISVDEKMRLTLEAIYNQYEGDKPVIVAHKSLTDNPLDVLTTGAPFVADKLREEKKAVWNEALEFLGINTNPSDKKKERLIVSEVDSNNEQIEMQSDVMLLARQEAAEQINKLFNLHITVKRRIDNHTVTEEEPADETKEGVVNG